MVVYIPDIIYFKCSNKGEEDEEFIRRIFEEWYEEFFVTEEKIISEIKKIGVIEH